MSLPIPAHSPLENGILIRSWTLKNDLEGNNLMDESLAEPVITASDGWKTAYSGAAAGFLVMRDVTNPPESPALEAQKDALEASLRERFADFDREALRAVEPIPAYTAYYRRFQKTYHVFHQLESVALKHKPIPRTAALVEAMFMAELANLLLTAGHDASAVTFPVRLDVAAGSETYTLLSGKEQTLTPGDMYMADTTGVLSSILFGPDERTSIRPSTTEVLFAVYAPAGVGAGRVIAHLADIAANVRLIAPQARIEHEEVVEA